MSVEKHPSSAEQRRDEAFGGSAIAIIGMACRFPGAGTIDEYWRNLRRGVESLTELTDEELAAAGVAPEQRLDPSYVRRASVVDGIEDFDAKFFGYTPLEATIMDPQQRLFLECAWEVFEQAGYDPESYPRPVGVFTGAKTNTYLFNVVAQRARFPALDNFQIALGNDLAAMATRVSFKLDLRGPSYALHTACSTSLVAVHLACQSLLLDECSMALAGGASINIPQRRGYPYQKGGILSPDGRCRTFDEKAAGSNFGNGAGAVLLKRLDEALADGDLVYAVIRGSATNNDGARKASFTAPGVEGQTAVLLEAMAASEVEADDVSYVEAHGTATDLGDSIEMLALTNAFRASTRRTGYCAIGSAKTNLGHLEAAAGVAGLIKTALALLHKELPPSLHFERPNPKIDFAASPFFVNGELRPWPQPAGKKRMAGVSSFGIGSTNAHVILEEAPEPALSGPDRPWQLVLLSARSAGALATMSENLGRHLAEHAEVALADVAYTLQVGRKAFDHRRTLVCRDRASGAAALAAGRGVSDGTRHAVASTSGRSVAFLFPGLGEHHVDMGLGLYQREPVFRDAVDRCLELLEPISGGALSAGLYPGGTDRKQAAGPQGPGELDLKAMLGRGGEPAGETGARLNRTALAQPAVFVVEYALAQLFLAGGIRPRAMIGYSLGEFVCACLAGVLRLEDALSLVARRAALIDRLPAGAMLAVGLREDETVPWLDRYGLSLAAVNGATGCVAAGPRESVEALEAALAEEGVMGRRLQTSHAFHSAMMGEIAGELTALVRAVRLEKPEIPYVSNVTGDWITDEEATDPGYWARHMSAPVRFEEGIGKLLGTAGEPALLEVGPGRSLTSFTRLHPGCEKSRPVVVSMRSRHQDQADAAAFLDALGQLWLAGVSVDWAARHAGAGRRRVALPTYPFERRRHWIDPDEETLARASGRGAGASAAGDPPRATPAALIKNPDLEQWLYRPVWRSAEWPDSPAAAADEGVWLLLADRLGVAEALAVRLAEHGIDVILAAAGDAYSYAGPGRYRLRAGAAGDYEKLLSNLAEQQKRLRRVVHLFHLAPAPAEPGDGESFKAAQELGFYSLIALAQALARRPRPAGAVEIDVVTSHVQDVTGDETLAPERSTLLGACVVIPQEHPNLGCRAVDVDLPTRVNGEEVPDVERIAGRIAKELSAPAGDLVVAHRGTERRVRSYERMTMPPAAEGFRFREGGVYLITGGLGGIGLLLSEHLAETAGVRLVLTRRSPVPAREEWDAWLAANGPDDATSRAIRRVRSLEAAGAEVMVASADVADEEAMRGLVEEARERFGALHGVIHAAGVLAQDTFKTVARITRRECELQFRPKTHGLYVLERVLAGEELDFCLLYSSISALLGGGLGSVAYATANAFMDAFVERHNREAAARGGGFWKSVDWDSWHHVEEAGSQGGFGATLSELAIAPAEGVEALRRLLALAEPHHVVISTGDLDARFAQWVELRSSRAEAAAGNGGATRARRSALKLSTGGELEEQIAAVWRRILGVEELDRDENFFDLGGNSLLGMQVIAELDKELGVAVEPVALFESPTVAGLARHLSPEPRASAGEAPARHVRGPGESVDVAVIGIDGRFPGASTIGEFWKNLREGRETTTFFSDEELLAAGVDREALADPQYVKARPILDGVELFDAPFFGYTPREAEIMDPQQRMFLEAAWAAFENAGYDVERYDGAVGVYAGASISTYLPNIYSNPDLVESVGTFQTMIGNEKDSLTTRVSYKLNLRGPSLAVQTYCSTSLVAIHLASRALVHGECDMALAGGVAMVLPQVSGYRFEKGGIGSVDGHIRAFDAKCSGIVFGNGLGVVVLKRLDDALADGDPVRAVIRGSAINNDGSGKAGYTATSVAGQAGVVSAALEVAGVDPETIGYMEAHGTGTPLGDPIEMTALDKAFRLHTAKKKFCPIGSVKTNVGHLDRAAGVSGFIKTVLALENREIPPSLHFEDPNPAIDFEDNAFYVTTELREWRRGETLRRACVNSLGLGGTNAHVVLEEAPEIAPSDPGRPWQLLVLSARTAEALEEATDGLAAHLSEHPEQPLADVAYTLQIGRKAMEHRRLLVVRDTGRDDASEALAGRRPQRVWSAVREPQPPPVVFLFPGLGGQYVDMARGLWESEPIFRDTFERCAELVRDELGLDLTEVLYPPRDRPVAEETAASGDTARPGLDLRRMLGRGAEDDGGGRLRETAVAQPALFVVEYALAKLLMSWGLVPRAMIGYSLGEYVAACLAGMISLEDALKVVARRARMIQELEAGAMLAVPMTEAEVGPRLGEALSLAAVNGPQQSVVAGPVAAVDELERQLTGEGIACRRLETTHAFHSRMMEELYEPFVELLRGIELRPPEIPFLSNVTGTWMSAEEATDPTYWARHMCSPVRFSESIEVLAGGTGRILLELGPGQTLGSLVLQHPAHGEKPLVLAALRHAYESQADLAFLYGALGKLWLTGVDVDWAALHGGRRRLRVALPSYPFARQAYWVEGRPGGHGGIARMGRAPVVETAGGVLYVPSWRRKRPPRLPSNEELAAALDPPHASWLIFAEGPRGGVGTALADRLRAAGRNVATVSAGEGYADLGGGTYTIALGERADYTTLLETLETPPDTVVHLWSLGAASPVGDGFEAAQARGFESLADLSRALGAAGRPLALYSVSAGAYAVTGEETLRPEDATVLAASKVLPREVAGFVCRSFDVTVPVNGSEETLAAQLLAEIAGDAPEQVVAYRGRHRWLPELEPVGESGEGAVRPRACGVYVLTGGLNGRGFPFASYLTQRADGARLVLLEPRPLAEGAGDEVARRRVAALRERGAQVLLLTVEITDAAALRGALAEVEARYGALHGVVHAAEIEGTEAYATIEESSSEVGAAAGRRFLRAKALGARALDEALAETGGEPLDFALLISSMSPLVGGLGLVNDAAAGLYLDTFAADRASWNGCRGDGAGRREVPWTSVNWDFFLDDDDTVRSAGLAASGPGSKPAEEASAIEQSALDGLFALLPTPQVIATPRSLATWNRLTEDAARGAVAAPLPGTLYPRPKLSSKYTAPQSETEKAITEIWEAMLGVSRIGIHDGFLELGGDSLLAARLAARLREALDLDDLPVRLFFEASTIEQLALEVERLRAAFAAEENQDLAELMALVGGLSEEDVETELARRAAEVVE